MKKQLALLGGKPIFDHQSEPDELFHWPIITEEDEQNCLDVIRRNKFSGTDINPMWRSKKLTEIFGPAGIGWYYEVVSERAEEHGDVTIAVVDLNLYVK